MNRFEIIGYITADLVLSYTEEKNIPFVKFQVGVKDRGAVDFVSVIAWRGVGTNIIKYAKKGDQIGLAGKIKTGKYEDKDGKMVYFQNCKIEDVTFIGDRKIIKVTTLPNENQKQENNAYVGDEKDPIQF